MPYTSRPVPPEQLLQAFKSAALSVTNLYKSAVQDQNNSRAAGYQDALDDLLRFLDSENLGLQDGEGWRVRQWVTERYVGTANQAPPEIDDDKSDSGASHAKDGPLHQPQPDEPRNQDDVVVQTTGSRQHDDPVTVESESGSGFSFTYTPDSSRFREVEKAHTSEEAAILPESAPEHSAAPVRIEVTGRGGRASHRTGALRQSSRFTNRHLNLVSGTKRKYPVPDFNFFDISNVGTRDGPEGGPKRGRTA